jgi:alcohol dehydrogenase (cytochrome c)
VCPGFAGATNWFAPSYSEVTHLLYFKALEDCHTFFLKPQDFSEGKEYYSTGVKHITDEPPQKILLAYDIAADKFTWRYPQVSSGWSAGGTMTTAGGVLFFGDDANSFEAVDAQTGKPLWHFNTGQSIDASPMSYAVGGKQYVAIAAGSDVFSFALP